MGASDHSAVSDAAKVFWKWEEEEDDGEGVGPVWIEHTDGTTVDWEQWVRRCQGPALGGLLSGCAYRLMIGENPVTPVSLNVAGVLDVGDDALFTATGQDPAELHVYTTGPNGTVRVTRDPGVQRARAGAGELRDVGGFELARRDRDAFGFDRADVGVKAAGRLLGRVQRRELPEEVGGGLRFAGALVVGVLAVVEHLGAALVDAQSDGGEGAVAVAADRLAESDERLEAAAGRACPRFMGNERAPSPG